MEWVAIQFLDTGKSVEVIHEADEPVAATEEPLRPMDSIPRPTVVAIVLERL